MSMPIGVADNDTRRIFEGEKMQEKKGETAQNAAQRCRAPAGGLRQGIPDRHRAARAITCPALHGVPAVKHELEVCAKLHYGMFDSERKQLQAIREIRNILKNYEISIPDLDKNTPTWKVLGTILEKLHGLIPNDFQWEIIESPNYLIRVYHKYSNVCEYDIYMLSLEYLPKLKNQNRKIYNLILSMMSLLNKHCNMPHMDMDERMLDYFDERIGEEKYEDDPDEGLISYYSDMIHKYMKGEPGFYENCINRLNFSIDDFAQMLAQFNPENDLEVEIFSWCFKGYELIRSGLDYNDFLDYEFERGIDGANPYNYMRFVWSLDDYMGEEVLRDSEEYCNSVGMIPFVHNFYLTGKDCLEINRLKVPQWPYNLMKFFEMGTGVSQKLMEA